MSKYQIEEIKTKEDYNPLSTSRDIPLTQMPSYAEIQRESKRLVRQFFIKEENKKIGFFQIIKYPLLADKSYLYIPHGPVIKETNKELIKELKTNLVLIAKEENAAFIRLDLYPPSISLKIKSLDGFIKPHFSSYYSAYFQAKFDWQLDISKTETEILAQMHPKTRYNIRLAEKKGVEIELVSGKDMMNYFEDFYALMQETAKRGAFNLHPKNYYLGIFKQAENDENITISVAKFNNKVLAIHMTMFFGDTAFYPFGGSTDESRNLMPTYLLHWKEIEEAKKRNCKWYNFGAIDIGEKVTHKNWSGITAFKMKFGGEMLEYSDFYDLVTKPFWYNLYVLRKRIQKIWR